MDESDFACGTMVPDDDEAINSRTRVCGDGVFAREPLGGPIALARYEPMLRKAAAGSRNRVFIAVVDSDGSESEHRILRPGESLVFGRHEQAGIRNASADVSLRHIAIALARSSTEHSTLLRVWDLATGKPFITEDGQLTEALSSDGPVFVTVGSVYIAIIPLGSLPTTLPLGTRELWQALPAREVISRVAQGSALRPLHAPGSSEHGHQTMITRIPSASAPEDCPAELAVASLCLRKKGSQRLYQVSAEALERGILIGRYDRCVCFGHDLSQLSRVHLLISKIGNDIVAIDTASTYGSKRSGHRFATSILKTQDELILAGALHLEWKYERLINA